MAGSRIPSSFIVAFLISLTSVAQTYQMTGGPIPDNGDQVEFSVTINDLPLTLDTVGFGLESVCLTAEHTWIEDLDIWLIAPDGTTILLISAQGGNTDHFTNTCLRQDAELSILQASSPYTGTYRPQGQLGLVNNGQTADGTWKLRILDTYPFADEGSLISAEITFGNEPATYIPFVSSNLPIVVIDTEGNMSIPNEPKIAAFMRIVDNGPGQVNLASGPYNDFEGHIGIERRGWSSASAPKKSYGIETRTAGGLDTSVAILGMPAEEDWVLSANYYDKSLLNNTLSYTLAGAMGHYAARHRHVEVVLNGEYIGVYVFMEKLKRDKNRIDIAKLTETDTVGDDVTGGYIIKVDKASGNDLTWVSPYPPAPASEQQIRFIHEYPKGSAILPEQAVYIRAYIDSFETALAGSDFADPAIGYGRFMDASSFIDLFLLNELSRNVDGYRISTYLHKDKASNGGKLKAGPAWDYDIAWGNANYCSGNNITGWAYRFGEVCPGDNWQVPFWWARLLEDPLFALQVRCRWSELRDGIFNTAALHEYCDSMATLLEAAQHRNFITWPILGVWVWPNPTPLPTTYAGEIQELKDWITDRSAWLDAALPYPGVDCGTLMAAEDLGEVISAPFPNPFEDHIKIQWTSRTIASIEVLDVLGRQVVPKRSVQLGHEPVVIAMPEGLSKGSYFLRMTMEDGRSHGFHLQH